MAKVLTNKGFERISNLQDKYKFQNTFAIESNEDALEFLQSLQRAYYIGLNIEESDLEFIEEALDNLI